jgi:glycosyltransferase involved in cell wall biosynthesis
VSNLRQLRLCRLGRIIQHLQFESHRDSAVLLSVIIPVHDGGDEFRLCLAALEASTRCPDEIIVADDASTDGSGHLARQRGVVVLNLEGPPHGPAFARNRGAEHARGDILVFLDADVAIHVDALALMEQYLTQYPEIAAVFGSYDAEPRAGGLVSRYKNLLHHYVHQHSRRGASTFWGACGAIRRQAFEALGGFNEEYARPKIEDIELGLRLRRAGFRVWLCPDMQVTHLKRWTLASLLRIDVFDRALPWTRLILQHTHLPSELNLNTRSRLSAVAAWAALVCLALALLWPWAVMGTLLSVAAVAALNADLYRFFWSRGGLRFAAGAAGLHLLYLLYSSLIFVIVAAQTVLGQLWARLSKRPSSP